MKVIVAFDSVYGNTRKVAEMITAELVAGGHEATLVSLREKRSAEVKGDMLFLGSPTRMGRMTGKAKRFAKKLDEKEWKGKKAVSFDTIMAMPDDPKERAKAEKWTVNGAAVRLAEMMRTKGLQVNDQLLRVPVTGLKGPLAENANEMVKEYLKKVM